MVLVKNRMCVQECPHDVYEENNEGIRTHGPGPFLLV